jgi:homogentisate 1,2-dioxygenase
MPMTFDKKGKYEVRIKSRDLVHSYEYSYHPLDVVGWDGCYYPYCFNIDDFSPIVGKHHMPPPTHQTFEAHNFVICSFCPRPLDFHPQAIVVPYNHSNLDSDEVLYYVQGNYKARKGIEVGSLSLHPQGIPHGPHPGTPEATIGATHTNELAVMCDTFAPLYPTTAALELDDLNYPRSWEHGWEPDAVESNGHANGHANGKSSKSAKTAKTAKSGSKKLSRVVETKAASTAVSTSAKTGKATAGRSTSARAGKAANTWD